MCYDENDILVDCMDGNVYSMIKINSEETCADWCKHRNINESIYRKFTASCQCYTDLPKPAENLIIE